MSRIIKISFLILTCFVLITKLNAQEKKIIDKIIAKVGGEILLYSDWMEQVAYFKEKQNINSEEEKCAVLENMLLQKFMVHQAKLDSIEVKDEEIEQQLNARIDQILQYMGGDYTKFEEYYGQPVSVVKDKFREDIKNQILTDRLQNKVMGSVNVTPDEVQHFYNTIPKDSLPYINAEVEISEIVYHPKPNAEQMLIARQKLEKIQQKIKAGEDFSKLASIYSDDPGSAKNGGNLGWMKRGTLVTEYEAAAYNLEKDSISAIVETEFGLHLIQLIGRRGNSVNTKHILIKPRITEADYDLATRYLDSIRIKIIKDTIPFELAVRLYSDKNAESYSNGGQLINPKSSNSSFETGELDPDIYFAIDKIKKGDLTKPISSTDQEGKKYYRIVKLNNYTSPHKANLKQDYAKIQNAAKEIKKSAKFKEWLEQKVPMVYNQVDPEIKEGCPGLTNWN